MDQAKNLRDMMEKRRRGKGMEVITVTGAKGGVGKSCVALNLAIALSRRGRRVLLVDADFGLANIDIMLGIKPKYDLSAVLNRQVNIRDAVEKGAEDVAFISGGSGVLDLIALNNDQLHHVIENLTALNGMADTLIFDTGAGINARIMRLILAGDETLVVTTPEPTAIMDAYALVKTIDRIQRGRRIHLIMNQADNEREAKTATDAFIRIAQRYTHTPIEPLGCILKDENMGRAIKAQTPLLVLKPQCPAALCIGQLADRYDGRTAASRNGMAGFLNRLLGKRLPMRG